MRYAWQAIRRRPARSGLTALGIGMATALVLILLALSAGIQSSASRLVAASGVDLIATSANTSLSAVAFPSIPDAHSLPPAIQRDDPNVAVASPWLITSITFANASLYAASNASHIPGAWQPTSSGSVGWIPGDNTGFQTPSVYAGPGFSSGGDPHFANGSYRGPATHEVVLDEGLAGVLHVGPGSLLWAGTGSPSGPSDLPGWFANATVLRVVGVSGPFWLIPSALLAFFYLSELQQLVAGIAPPADSASLLLVHLHDPSIASRDQSALGHAYPGLSFFTTGNILSAVNGIVELYRTFGTLVGLVGLAVAALFATTVLLMSVDDRSREIALLRAIGFTRSLIAGYVVEEAVVLSIAGLAVGLVGGAVGAYALDRFLTGLVAGLPAGFSFVQFDAGVILFGVAEVLLLGLFAAILPAWRALSIPVAEELRAP